MIRFAWPWVFALAFLPLAVRWLFAPTGPAGRRAVRVPFLAEIRAIAETSGPVASRRWQLAIASLAWLLLVSAAARPQWLGETTRVPMTGRDLMLAVDISGSMEYRDFRLKNRIVNRLTALKAVAGDFIDRREGDRIGLILFGRRAYLQTPLTFDRDTVRTLLFEAEVGLAGKETAIGDAIGLAIKRLRQREEGSRVLVLLTDGANTAGEVDPLRAAELAAAESLKIYTVGIGSDSGRRSFFNLGRGAGGDLDEAALRAIADATDGAYFRARSTAELDAIYRAIDALEPVEQDGPQFRPMRALYPWPLGAALALAALVFVARTGLSMPARSPAPTPRPDAQRRGLSA